MHFLHFYYRANFFIRCDYFLNQKLPFTFFIHLRNVIGLYASHGQFFVLDLIDFWVFVWVAWGFALFCWIVAKRLRKNSRLKRIPPRIRAAGENAVFWWEVYTTLLWAAAAGDHEHVSLFLCFHLFFGSHANSHFKIEHLTQYGIVDGGIMLCLRFGTSWLVLAYLKG